MSYSLHNSEVFRVLHTQIYPRYGGTREAPIACVYEVPPASDWVTVDWQNSPL